MARKAAVSAFSTQDSESDFADENSSPPIASKNAKKPAVRATKKTNSRVKSSETIDLDSGSEAGLYNSSDIVENDPSSDFGESSTPQQKKKAGLVRTSNPKPLKDVANELDENGVRTTIAKQAKTNSQAYQKLTQLEHILKRPDTYIGSVEASEKQMWIYDRETKQMVYKTITIVPGLYKIFDEILVNAADNKIRDPTMDVLKVGIDKETNTISIFNNGKGIPIEIHDKEKVYIPELIFGHLLTSSNYDDDEKKVTGGRNGYGAKLCNIFSTEFIVETADKISGKKYKQVWNNNMSKIGKPRITENKKGEEYTKITFKPDLKLFQMDEMDSDLIGVMMRRVYDLAGTVRDVKVYLNNERLQVRNFKSYVEMYVKSLAENQVPVKGEMKEESPDGEPSSSSSKVPASPAKRPTIIYERVNDRWEVAFAVSDGSFNQVSFVNSIATTSGGTHVQYITDQLVAKITEAMKKKNKKSSQIRPAQIRSNIFLFVNCLIENPAFNSQTKEQLTTRPSAFGSKCILTDDFMKRVLKSSITETLTDVAEANADKELRKTDGNRRSRVTGYVKLEDANKAGTREGHKCTLILTEGDSAMSLAVAGLAVVGRDYYGVFPLRGKLLNVREASADQVAKNAEIQAIKRIMGLQHKKRYTDTKELRYGRLMIMTDQDHDGSHIKGLIINFLQSTFPGLLEIAGFLVEFITPIVKVTIMKGQNKTIIPFYTMPEYEQWRETVGKTCKWKQKYYKGLGTSDHKEGREYFGDLGRHLKTFDALIETKDIPCIDLAFSKKKADDRKDWLRQYKPGTHLDPNLTSIPIDEFINKELILFSMADNIRSIPSVLDGFKPGQRKVLYACFKRNLKSEIKVAQLAGYVSEHTGYHHGEQSLVQTIIGLAQDFVGSNNVYLLKPNGCFGTRAAGGKDASAARYIFTELSPLTRRLFKSEDEPLYRYMQDDEQTVEPEWYLPILPMILVNGAEGIGTGWSTNIPSYNPQDIIANLKRMMDGQEVQPMMPWYRGWEGHIEPAGPDKFAISGKIEQIDDNTLEITELPVHTWTTNMKEFLLNGITGTDKIKPWIKDMTEQHGTGIKFVVTLSDDEMKAALKEGLHQKFKLLGNINTGNMVAFDSNGRIKKYSNAQEILSEFYHVRLEYYQRRKDQMADRLSAQHEKLSEQARFVKLIIDKELVVSNRKREDLISDLQKRGFPAISKQAAKSIVSTLPVQDDNEGDVEEDADSSTNVRGVLVSDYDYLLGMAIWSLTRERYEKLLKEKQLKEDELNELLKLSAKDLWKTDLEEFSEEFGEFLDEDRFIREEAALAGMKGKNGRANAKGKAVAARKRKAKLKAEGEDDVESDGDFAPSKAKRARTGPTTNSPSSSRPKLKQAGLDFGKKEMSTTSIPIDEQKTNLSPIKLDKDDDDELYESPIKKTKNVFGRGDKGIFGSPFSQIGKNTEKVREVDPEDLFKDMQKLVKGVGKSSTNQNRGNSSKAQKSSFAFDAAEKQVIIDSSSENEDAQESKSPVKSTTTRTKTTIANKKKPAPAKSRALPKKNASKVIAFDSDEDEPIVPKPIDDSPAASTRSSRGRKPVSYAILDGGDSLSSSDDLVMADQDEDEDESFDEEDE